MVGGDARLRPAVAELRRGNLRREEQIGGAEEDRTPYPHVANVVLYQMSYRPRVIEIGTLKTGEPIGRPISKAAGL